MEDRQVIADAIGNARALLETLGSTAWTEVHIQSGGTEIFITRDSSRQDPLSGWATASGSHKAGEAAVAQAESVAAPHVATIVDLAAPGTRVSTGDVIGRLSVLDMVTEVRAGTEGRILSAGFNKGDLVQFGEVLLQVAADS